MRVQHNTSSLFSAPICFQVLLQTCFNKELLYVRLLGALVCAEQMFLQVLVSSLDFPRSDGDSLEFGTSLAPSKMKKAKLRVIMPHS